MDSADTLNLAGILNTLDGVVDTPGRLLVMTSNHPEKLDPALIRHLAMGQNQVPLVNIPKMNRIVFMGMFTYPFLVIIGIDPPTLVLFAGRTASIQQYCIRIE